VAEIERRLEMVKDPLTIAVMGCVVNGPGEARHADFGIAAGKRSGVLFRKGQIVRKVREEEFVEALMAEVTAFQ
jgi:(E)-4-hydroxy-3-methylbut-2-enyl-diphosphate synthase